MKALLIEEAGVLMVLARAALDNYADVVDGSYGEPRPNWAMSLQGTLDHVISRVGSYGSVHTSPEEQERIEWRVVQALGDLEDLDTDRYPKLKAVADAATRIADQLTACP